MKRSAAETIRMIEQIARMRGLIDGLAMSVSDSVPVTESAAAVAQAAYNLVASAARRDAYTLAEGDAFFKDKP